MASTKTRRKRPVRMPKPHCPNCRHPDYRQGRLPEIDRPQFTCVACGRQWTCGKDGGEFAKPGHKMILDKVISGAQTGADEAGLRAAKHYGIPTGGTISKGYRTLGGARPEYADEFGIVEHPSWQYPPRTEANVRDSDATIRFATDWNSRGELLTKKIIDKRKKPSFDVDPSDPPLPAAAAEWIVKNRIRVLNVAGNSEQTSPGIGKFTTGYLAQVFSALEEMEQQL